MLFNCTFGVTDSPVRIALIGDSHAMAIFPAIEQLAVSHDWSLTTYLRASCPLMTYVCQGLARRRRIATTGTKI